MAEKPEYNFKAIEEKWQKEWEKAKAFQVKEDSKKKKYYVLEMFPYPSGSGLHMGHALNYTIGDAFSRFKRMQGFNVLYPMGYDSFGLPAENAAIKAGEHPLAYTKKSMANFEKQQRALGLSYDWTRIVKTCMPEYYKWNQYFFLKFLEAGLVYRKKAAVNWCPECQTVLANEQVHSGKCWRHTDTDVEIKHLEQWFIKTTKYSDELLETSKLKWPERIKLMQENWIGKSHGTEIDFTINGEKWPIFTTRCDTIYGVTFMVISAQHPRLFDIVTDKQKKEVENFLRKLKSVSEKELEEMEKEGVFTGSYAINPVTNEKVPVYAGNFVVADYGGGMVMAVPAHDQRDYEFAKKYKLEIKQVIAPLFKNTFEKDEVRADKKIEERDSVAIIVKHWKDEKYFCLDWKEHKWKSFLLGGIEKGEKPEEAAIREVKEETGYSDIKSIKKIGFEVHANFYASHKDVNRYGKYNLFVVELKSDKYKKPSEEETKNHLGLWVEKEKVINFLNLENHKYAWDIYLNGERAYVDSGVLVNSKEFNGIQSLQAKEKISSYIEKKKIGRKVVQYKFRDWLISRQRYWGTPIPVVYCPSCGIVPFPEKELPILLPEKVKFGEGNPLATNKDFVETKCPKCKGKARRETDTMDTFFDSSWYFLRYCDFDNDTKAFEEKKVKYWMPVDQYIGGAEHACMHLIYARFFVKALRDMNMLNFDEPFLSLFNQGMLHGSDGNKMSKSLGNVINPLDMIIKYGADTLRLNLMSLASPDKDSIWNDRGMESNFKFVKGLFEFFSKTKASKSSDKLESKLNKTIKEYSSDIENFSYNLAIIKLRGLFSVFEQESFGKEAVEKFLKMFSLFCPHIAEELWHTLGNKSFISLEIWPEVDESKIDEKFEQEEKSQDKLVEDIKNIIKILEARGQKDMKEIKIFAIPKEIDLYKESRERLEKIFNMKVEVLSIQEAPQNLKSKAKPGKPAIHIV